MIRFLVDAVQLLGLEAGLGPLGNKRVSWKIWGLRGRRTWFVVDRDA